VKPLESGLLNWGRERFARAATCGWKPECQINCSFLCLILWLGKRVSITSTSGGETEKV